MNAIARDVYVISDLHIGGTYSTGASSPSRGFRICNQVDLLTRFVTNLAEHRSGESPEVELVINGDFVDFLAEESSDPEQWRPFLDEPQIAVRCLDTIVQRDAQLFAALRLFVQNGHHLTILLGNHDVELSLPAVRHRFESLIGIRSDSCYRFLYDGEAYVVGDALIEHGNRYDGFNTIDHGALRRVRSSQSRRLPIRPEHAFQPPPGSRLVSSIMNPIKRDYPFIDLLKPETCSVIPVLLALDPGYRGLLGGIARLYVEARQHSPVTPAQPAYGDDIAAGMPQRLSATYPTGDLGMSQPSSRPAVSAEDALRAVLEEQLGHRSALEFLAAIDPAAEEDTHTRGDIVSMHQAHGLLRLLTARKTAAVERRLPALLDALCALQNDHSFRRDVESGKEYLEAAQALADVGFRYVVFGHTHLAKHVALGHDRYYLNSGTWADFMRVPTSIIDGPRESALQQLRAFLEELTAGRGQGWVTCAPTYVQLLLGHDGRIVDAQLRAYESSRI